MHFRRLTYTDDMSSSHSRQWRLSGSEFPHICLTKLRLILLSIWTCTGLSIKFWFLWHFLLETSDLPVAPSAAYWMRRTLQWLIRLRHSVYTELQLVPRCSGAVRAKRAGLSGEFEERWWWLVRNALNALFHPASRCNEVTCQQQFFSLSPRRIRSQLLIMLSAQYTFIFNLKRVFFSRVIFQNYAQ